MSENKETLPLLAKDMTLRDWFAGQALAGIADSPERDWDFHDFARYAYDLADAMMKERP